MTRYVVDASVVVKWFVPEIHSEAALQFTVSECELLAPDFLLTEVGNILWKKIRRAELTRNEGREVLRVLRRAPLQIHPSELLLQPAFEIACSTGRSVYDSLYLGLAVLRRCRAVTADRRLYNALQGSPFTANVHWIQEGP
ncbi:MAG: type II toxin-antitoxin system VapC family toxin [Acidobacteria bacterium]|nr:type II toxin-antitoxin system VapC family toxin [Acidobacteriota bacterium]